MRQWREWLRTVHADHFLVICAWLWVCATLAALFIWNAQQTAQTFALLSISTAVAALAMRPH